MQQLELVKKNLNIEISAKDLHFKDEGLNELANIANVAQFISFDSKLKQRYSRIKEFSTNEIFNSIEHAIGTLLQKSTEGAVNVRSYHPESPESNPFIKGLSDVQEVISTLHDLAGKGLYTIVNEKINEKDGGVSGVVFGNIIEFAPDVVPRGVDDIKVSPVALPRKLGVQLLQTVYGFIPELNYKPEMRVEFSIHPTRKGFRNTHTTVWEIRNVGKTPSTTKIHWPNDFSRKLGDKAFGLLIAFLHGLPVPRTTVISRFAPPFIFGNSTGTAENWIRTCPTEPIPGLFTTQFGWIDPFAIMQKEDPEGTLIASVLSQDGVEAIYSGALLTSPNGKVIIEGIQGRGDTFMVGETAIADLPRTVIKAVKSLYQRALKKLGPLRMEWVYDGKQVWVVQLHIGASSTSGNIIYPGEAIVYHRFIVSDGLEKLRLLISQIEDKNEGIILVGNIGVSSHLGDILRRSKIPSRIEKF